MIMIPAMRLVTWIVGKYSLRRTVGVANKNRMPIIGFRTQQMPILHALAQLAVMTPFADRCVELFKDESLATGTRHGVAVTMKAVFLQMVQSSMPELIERCGAQGTFQHNQICDADVGTWPKSLGHLANAPFYRIWFAHVPFPRATL